MPDNSVEDRFYAYHGYHHPLNANLKVHIVPHRADSAPTKDADADHDIKEPDTHTCRLYVPLISKLTAMIHINNGNRVRRLRDYRFKCSDIAAKSNFPNYSPFVPRKVETTSYACASGSARQRRTVNFILVIGIPIYRIKHTRN